MLCFQVNLFFSPMYSVLNYIMLKNNRLLKYNAVKHQVYENQCGFLDNINIE